MKNRINIALVALTLTSTFAISNKANVSQNVDSDYKVSFRNHG